MLSQKLRKLSKMVLPASDDSPIELPKRLRFEVDLLTSRKSFSSMKKALDYLFQNASGKSVSLAIFDVDREWLDSIGGVEFDVIVSPNFKVLSTETYGYYPDLDYWGIGSREDFYDSFLDAVYASIKVSGIEAARVALGPSNRPSIRLEYFGEWSIRNFHWLGKSEYSPDHWISIDAVKKLVDNGIKAHKGRPPEKKLSS